MKYSEFFGRRKSTFEKTYELIRDTIHDKYTIIELGSSRSFVTGGKKGCMMTDTEYWKPDQPEIWDWGAGIFTKVFAENLKDTNCKIITIDPDSSANSIVTHMCKDYNNVIVKKEYSTEFINSFSGKIDCLYMDHMETCEKAALQHLEDIRIIIEKNLMSENGIILIDDVGNDSTYGKGKYSIPFLLNNGYKILIHDYQVLMVKM
jgi:hypothetical protein